MKKQHSLSILLSILFLLPPMTCLGLEDQDGVARISKTFTLYPGKKGDPYTLFYPLELKRPGQINVYVKADTFDPMPKSKKIVPLRTIIVDARAFKNISPSKWKKWVHKVNQYNPAEWVAGSQIRSFVSGVKHLFGKREKPPAYFHGQTGIRKLAYGSSIKHAVDAPELQKTGGRYVVILRNVSPLTAKGTISIGYPGDKWEYDPAVEKHAKVRPDLTIDEISLNSQNQLQVKIVNHGVGSIRFERYHQPGSEMVTLLVKVGGRNYGATLSAFDPEQKLRKRDQPIVYTFERLKITKPTEVSVTVDHGDKLEESNESNNTRTEVIGGIKFIGKVSTKPMQ